ncbi:MAG: SDR family oxidoreductase [Rhodothermales bacterium]
MPSSDRIFLVTGANSGIGKVTAEALARTGGTVLMVCRNAERGEQARDEIVRATQNERVELLLADLASQDDIRQLAEQVTSTYDRLDVLVNNAGLYKDTYVETPDGIETTWAVNHLAPFLLTNLLLGHLKASEQGRIINVSSGAHKQGQVHFDDPNLKAKYNGLKAYAQSKLANVLHAVELSRRLRDTVVTANALHPGVVGTNIGSGTWASFFFQGLSFLLLSPEKGARTSIYLATSPEVSTVSGQYFVKCEPVTPARQARDVEVARKLWTLSEAMTSR